MGCRGHGQAIDCVSYVTGTEWVSGGSDGGVALWSQLKKKPVHVQRAAHVVASVPSNAEGGARGAGGPGSAGGDCASWVSAVACARGTDLVVRSNDHTGVTSIVQNPHPRHQASLLHLKHDHAERPGHLWTLSQGS